MCQFGCGCWLICQHDGTVHKLTRHLSRRILERPVTIHRHATPALLTVFVAAHTPKLTGA